MKKLMLASALTVIVLSGLYAQESRFYGSGGAEICFSYAAIDVDGNTEGSMTRFAPVFNLQGFVNYDFSNAVGLFTGLGIRNAGFIYEPPDDHITMKYRSYNLAIPLGVKFGKLDYMMIFGGYEAEFPFNYKEKKLENEGTEAMTEWFSGRVVPLQHTIMAGVQFPYGIDLKFKYYITNFHNRDYVEYIDGESFRPYADLKSNIIMITLGWNLFTDFRSYKRADYFENTLTWDEQPLVVTNRPSGNPRKP